MIAHKIVDFFWEHQIIWTCVVIYLVVWFISLYLIVIDFIWKPEFWNSEYVHKEWARGIKRIFLFALFFPFSLIIPIKMYMKAKKGESY